LNRISTAGATLASTVTECEHAVRQRVPSARPREDCLTPPQRERLLDAIRKGGADARGDQDDAKLIVELGSLWTQIDGIQANGWIWSDAFVADPDEYGQKYPGRVPCAGGNESGVASALTW
jgi:hypothetical protein